MQVELIVVPYDSGRRGERMGRGPEHLLAGGLIDRIERLGHTVSARPIEVSSGVWPAEIGSAFELIRGVAEAVRQARSAGRFPFVLAGNCSASAGVAAGLGGDPILCWFDAHGDFNTPETTIGGFLDGMALAILTGRCWRELANGVAGFRPVPESDVVLIGGRDLDPLERGALDASAIRRVPERGIRAALPAALDGAGREARAAHVHIDLDVLDPAVALANSYAAPGGLTLEDARWAVEAIGKRHALQSATVAAYDPSCDSDDRARRAAFELIEAVLTAAYVEEKP
jgi:arginase